MRRVLFNVLLIYFLFRKVSYHTQAAPILHVGFDDLLYTFLLFLIVFTINQLVQPNPKAAA